MGSEPEIRRQRIGRLLDQVIWPATHPMWAELDIAISRLAGEPISPEQAAGLAFEPFQVGDAWGGAWSTAWLKATGFVPTSFEGRHLVARVELGYRGQPGFGGEALVFDGSRPRQGINPRHTTVELSASGRAGDRVEVLVEAAANPAPREGPLEWPLLLPDYDGTPLYNLKRFDLAVVDDAMVEVLYDWTVLTELVDALGLGARRSAEIVHVLDRVARNVDLQDLGESVVNQRHQWLPLLEAPTGARAHQVTAVGHAHIDSAWLWPIRETRRKCARTLSTAVGLMEVAPDYVFVCSQAQQHAWIEEQYPALFDEMKRFVAAGQLEPVGSMWVEPDTNLPSGESLARQLIFGKRYFLDRYGIETTDCWLPDAFGYSGNLPQILRAANVTRFVTQKLSWNETNAFPHHTFWWEGIDGSRVLAHCPPTDTYNGEFTVDQLLAGEARFAHHGISDKSLYAYGFGDGGGGPTAEMLERARRMGDLDPLPMIRLGTARGFFDELEQDIASHDEQTRAAAPSTVPTAHAPGPGGLPVWSGELYLERHRGVQTTQARAKLGNRRSENLLREAELWAAAVLDADEAAVVAPRLEHAWQLLLLHQFHDILPGSSIHWVHDDSQSAYGEIADVAADVIARATGKLAAQTELAPLLASRSLGAVLVLNPGTNARTGVADIDLASLDIRGVPQAAVGPDGTVVPVQQLGGGRVIFPAHVPGSGWAAFTLLDTGGALPVLADSVHVSDRTLSNGLVSVSLDADGLVSSIRDLANDKEVLARGQPGNLFQLHHDLPNHFDAWDVDQHSFERAADQVGLESMETTESGPVRGAIRLTRRIGSATTLRQEVRLAAGSRRVEFVTEVDWQERHRFLKVAFPVAVRSPRATYEIQFGHVERPTHANTSWDAAKFEVPAQRWAALSEPGFGVALLNDCKHGYDIRQNVMRLSLLRGPGWPDPEADAGWHRFTYAILAYEGELGIGQVVHEAESLNLPLRVVACPPSGGGLPGAGAVLGIEGAMLSAVTRAGDGSGDLIARLYEHRGAHARATVSGLHTDRASRVDLLERHLVDVPLTGDQLSLELRPFELVTLRFTRR
ncbi:MAG: alpha-mannosidase [Acidimicrobiales bacterium]